MISCELILAGFLSFIGQFLTHIFVLDFQKRKIVILWTIINCSMVAEMELSASKVLGEWQWLSQWNCDFQINKEKTLHEGLRFSHK